MNPEATMNPAPADHSASVSMEPPDAASTASTSATAGAFGAHRSVLLSEVVEALRPRPGGRYADVTLGGGGHAAALLDACSPDGRLWGVDRDPVALAAATARLAAFGSRFTPVAGRFRDAATLLAEAGPLDGLVADLGVSSPQLDRPERGFSFRAAGPVDMRMDQSSGETALELILRVDESTLADILYRYGEERASRRVARVLKEAAEAGELTDTLALARVIGRVVGRPPGRGGIDPATRSFQALRIAVNDELREVDQLLAAAPTLLAPGGRLAIISFHSLEDRIVKHRLREHPGLRVLTARPIEAGDAETAHNPRARSAKLRVAERVTDGTDQNTQRPPR